MHKMPENAGRGRKIAQSAVLRLQIVLALIVGITAPECSQSPCCWLPAESSHGHCVGPIAGQSAGHSGSASSCWGEGALKHEHATGCNKVDIINALGQDRVCNTGGLLSRELLRVR
jgi:hypothetical protein